MLEEQKSQEMLIYYNYDYRKAALEIRDNNTITKHIFNFDTDEIFSITCKFYLKSLILNFGFTKIKRLLAKSSVFVPILAVQPDFKPEFPSKCETFKLSTSPLLNYYFGFSTSILNSTAVIPGAASTIFRFSPQVIHPIL